MKVQDFMPGGKFRKWPEAMLFPVFVFPELKHLPFQYIPLNMRKQRVW